MWMRGPQEICRNSSTVPHFDEVQPGNGLSLVVDDCVGLNPESAKGFGQVHAGPDPATVPTGGGKLSQSTQSARARESSFVAGGSIRPLKAPCDASKTLPVGGRGGTHGLLGSGGRILMTLLLTVCPDRWQRVTALQISILIADGDVGGLACSGYHQAAFNRLSCDFYVG